MQWIDSVLYPLARKRWQITLQIPALIALGSSLFAGMVAGGFLYIVGIKALSLAMAFGFLLVTGVLSFSLIAGYWWEILSRMQEESVSEEPRFLPLRLRHLGEGVQLLLFYLGFFGFFISLVLILCPVASMMSLALALLLLHPVFMVPALASARNRSLLGLLDGCLDLPQLLKANYPWFWMQTTGYLLVCGGLLYSLLIALCSISLIGIVLIPGLMMACCTGYAHLLAHFMASHRFPAAIRRAHFPVGHYPTTAVSLEITKPVTGFAVGNRKRAPWQQ